MNYNKSLDCERTKIEKWSRFQLSYKWKRRGILLSVFVLTTLIVLKFLDTDYALIKEILKRGLLVSLLIISLSKDKQEDEMIVSLRAKSLTVAFIFGVLYALIQPAVTFLVHNLVFDPSPFNSFSYFEVLSFMLMIQIAFFEVLKRNR